MSFAPSSYLFLQCYISCTHPCFYVNTGSGTAPRLVQLFPATPIPHPAVPLAASPGHQITVPRTLYFGVQSYHRPSRKGFSSGDYIRCTEEIWNALSGVRTLPISHNLQCKGANGVGRMPSIAAQCSGSYIRITVKVFCRMELVVVSPCRAGAQTSSPMDGLRHPLKTFTAWSCRTSNESSHI